MFLDFFSVCYAYIAGLGRAAPPEEQEGDFPVTIIFPEGLRQKTTNYETQGTLRG